MCGNCTRTGFFTKQSDLDSQDRDATDKFGPDLNDGADADYLFEGLVKPTDEELAEIEAIRNSMRIL